MSEIRCLAVAMAAVACLVGPLSAAASQGDWMMRGGVGLVDPKSDNLRIPGLGQLQVDTGYSATLEGTYMFRDHWGVELLVSTPFSHSIALKPVAGVESNVGRVKQVLPTLSLQYHINPDGQFRPYVGLGLNYTLLFDEEATGALAGSRLSLDNSFGLAAQVGADIGLSGNWYLNVVARYIDIDSQAELDGSDLGNVQIDPMVYQLQVGYRFGADAR